MRYYFLEFQWRIVLIVLVLWFKTTLTIGQYDATIKSHIPVSPNAASMGKVAEAAVSTFSGTVNVNIPLYNDVENMLGYEISCAYNTGGIKSSEIASSIGLGWSLNAGGAIVRSMRGAPDETLFIEQITGFYSNGVDPTWSNNALYLEEIIAGKRDIQSDVYFFNFMGYSGSFYFDHNQNIVQRIPSNLKIEVINTGYQYNEILWKVITPDGTIYYFGDDMSDGVSDDAVGYSNQYVQPKDMVAAPNRYTPLVDSWYLVKIESFDKKSVIYFDYDEYEAYSFRDLGTSSNYYIDSLSNFYSLSPVPLTDLNPVLCTESLTPRLTQIRTSNRKITFTYSGDIRKDLDDWGTPGYHPRYIISVPSAKIFSPKPLSEITIKSSSGTTFYKYNFHHSYFVSTDAGFTGTFGITPQTDAFGTFYTDMRRLKLDSISMMANNETVHKHKFNYFDNEIQRRCSYGQDLNGYPNGISSNITLLPKLIIDTLANTKPMIDLSEITSLADRSTSEFHTKKPMLQSIIYPHGGSRTFNYEGHDHYANKVITSPSNILSLRNCSFPSASCLGGAYYGGPVTMTVSNTTSFVINMEAERTDAINTPFDVQVLVSVNGGSTYQIMENYVLNSGNNYMINAIINAVPYSANGVYHFQIVAPTNRNVFMNLTITQYTRSDLMANVPVGGLRVQSIVDAPIIGNPTTTTYEYTQAPGNNNSSGFVVSTPIFINKLPITSEVTIGYVSVGGMWSLLPPNPLCIRLKYRFTSGNSFALSSTQGSHIGYHQVRVYDSNNQGHVAYHHIINDNFKAKPYRDFPILPEYFVPDSLGKLDTVKYINQSDVVIRKEAYDYFEHDFMQNDTSYYIDSYSECSALFYFWGQYKNRSRFNDLYKKTVTEDGVTTATTFQYQGIPTHTLLTKSTMTNSDGKVHVEEMFYPDSYTVNATIKAQLLAENRWLPAWQTTSSVNNVIVDGSQTLYAYQNPSTGFLLAPTATSSNSKIYPAKQNRREITWTAGNGLQDNGWQLLAENLKFDLVSGKPSSINGAGWPNNHTLNWTANGKLSSTTYVNHTSSYIYGLQHDLLAQKTNIDGTYTNYLYDAVLRPKTLTDLPKNNVTQFTYHYGNATTSISNVKTRTTYPPSTDSAIDSIVHISYVDGLGRPIQANHKYGAPDGSDVITQTEYDNVGRTYRTYEPIAANGNHGAYYTGALGGGYTQQLYESNPLDRVSQSQPPAWQPTNHTYGTNTMAFTNPEGQVFANHSLMRTTTTDPDGLSTDIYSDKRGRTVLQRQRDASNTTDTWTVYDDKNRPVKIYPPGSSPATPGLIYEFRYDGDDNVVYKKVPDATAEEYRYSVRNLQTAKRNAVLQAAGRWLVTRYDVYGRPTQRGYHNGSDPGASESATIHTLLEVYHYDGFNGATTNTAPIYKGKLKKSRIKVLEDTGTNSNWVETEYFYDSYGRVMTQIITNHLGGGEVKTYTYDFADNMTVEVHSIGGANGISHETKHIYDAQGRKVYDNINIDNTGERTTAECRYDHKSQIIERNLGRHSTTGTNQYLQSLDYTYNPQGWLTGINDLSDQLLPGYDPCDIGIESSGTAASTSADNDIFAFAIDYNTTLSGSGVPARQNGNITALKWWHLNQYNQTYSYKYDHLNRVTEARHGEIQGTSYSLKNQYNEQFLYDPRGNMTKLDRKGMVQRPDIQDNCYKPMTIDSLTYVYALGTNQLVQVVDKAPCPEVITLPAEIDRDIIYAASQEIRIDHTKVGCGVEMSLYAPNTLITDSLILLKQTCTAPMVTAYPGPCPQTKYTEGFNQQSMAGLYTYDTGGNLIFDPNKKVTFYYNYHNLPYKIVGAENDELQLLYSADGTLLQRKYLKDGVQISKRDYLRGKEYKSDILESVYHADGRVIKKGSLFTYEYHIKDHLGNVRVTFEDLNNNGNITSNEIKSRNDYYSFGMEWNNRWELSDTISPENRYRFNGKERWQEMNLSLSNYHNRLLDLELCRFTTVDKLSSHPNQVDKSGYAAFWNNPVLYNDPDGNCPLCWILVGFLMLESKPASTPGNDKDHRTIHQAQKEYNENQLVSLLPGGKQVKASHIVAGRVVNEVKSEVKEEIVKKSFDEAREEAFEKAGMRDGNVEFSKYDQKTGTVVEFKGKDGAKVAYDGPHPNTPGKHHDKQHIGWQSAGKRGNNGAKRDNIPYAGPWHPSRTDIKELPFLDKIKI